MSSLPPGVTDSMCCPATEYCARCGHEAEIHDDDLICDHRENMSHIVMIIGLIWIDKVK